MKKLWIVLCIGLCLVIPFMLFLALIGNYDLNHSLNRYPWYRAERWYCEEIDMTIQFQYNEEGNYIGGEYSQLVVDGKTYEVGIGFQSSAIGFHIDEDGDDIWEGILDGTWGYQQENMVIRIGTESIFDGKYSELVFVPCEE